MKKYTRLVCGLLVAVGLSLTLPTFVHAAGGLATPEVSVSSSKVTTGSKITITVFTATFKCDDTTYYSRSEAPCGDPVVEPKANMPVGITVSGSGNTVGGGSEGTNGVRYGPTGSDGKIIFTVSSTVAEGKTITARYYESDTLYGPTGTATVTFTTPAVTTQPKTTTPTPTPEPTPPEVPKVSTVEVGGKAATATDNITVKHDEPFKLTGKTVANGVVKLYIFSTPKEATTTADAEGNWSYEVKDLEPGTHHIEAEVTDPATSKTSTRATLANFTVEEAPQEVATTEPAPTNGPNIWLWITPLILLLVAAGVGFWVWWRKKHGTSVKSAGTPRSVSPNEAATPEVPPATEPPTNNDKPSGTPK